MRENSIGQSRCKVQFQFFTIFIYSILTDFAKMEYIEQITTVSFPPTEGMKMWL